MKSNEDRTRIKIKMYFGAYTNRDEDFTLFLSIKGETSAYDYINSFSGKQLMFPNSAHSRKWTTEMKCCKMVAMQISRQAKLPSLKKSVRYNEIHRITISK